MRYFVVTYMMRPNGQYDEQVQVMTKISDMVNRTANVILDFKEKKVVKARMDQPIERDWFLIKSYYEKIYQAIIQTLEKEYPPEPDAS